MKIKCKEFDEKSYICHILNSVTICKETSSVGGRGLDCDIVKSLAYYKKILNYKSPFYLKLENQTFKRYFFEDCKNLYNQEYYDCAQRKLLELPSLRSKYFDL